MWAVSYMMNVCIVFGKVVKLFAALTFTVEVNIVSQYIIQSSEWDQSSEVVVS